MRENGGCAFAWAPIPGNSTCALGATAFPSLSTYIFFLNFPSQILENILWVWTPKRQL
jgi:hypothetical protein